MEKVLSSLATKRGIAESFTDIWGKTSQTSLEAKKHILSAMGYPVEDDSLMISIEKKKSFLMRYAVVEQYILLEKMII